LIVAFTIGYAPNPRPYGNVTPTSRMGWAGVPLATLDRRGPRASPPPFSDDMTTFDRAISGGRALPILDMPLFMSAEDDRRFLFDAAARHGDCLVRHGDEIILVQSPEAPGADPRFTFIAAPQRPYKRMWSDAVFVATYPARLALVAGFLLLALLASLS
jgi:hypothetical protein